MNQPGLLLFDGFVLSQVYAQTAYCPDDMQNSYNYMYVHM